MDTSQKSMFDDQPPRADLDKLKISRVQPQARLPARRLRKLTGALIIAAIVFAIAFAAYRMTLGAPPEVETTAVAMAYPYQSQTVLNATGYVVAQRKASVASKATGRLEWLGVAEGSRVRKGEVIARLESQDMEAARSQAAANVTLARANVEQALAEEQDASRQLERTRELLAQSFVSQAAYDSALARNDKARAAVNSARAAASAAAANLRAAQVSVEQTVIRAPFDGVVLTKNANVGDTITPFSQALDTKGAVVTMADMSTLEVEADVAESNLEKVRVGQDVVVELDALPEVRFEGKVNRVVPTVDRAKATVMTKIAFKQLDPRILPDMSARVSFLTQAPSADERTARLAVRADALVRDASEPYVFAVREDKAVRVPVATGRTMGDLVEITRGLRVGEKVIVNPPRNLRDGMRVRTARR
jgi:RND family efflux transporter MFP subunit